MKASGFGKAVRERRTASGLTQQQLAERLSVGQAYISGVERGLEASNPTRATIERFAEALGTTPLELFSSDLASIPGSALFEGTLKALRLERSWTQHELADRSNLQERVIEEIEGGLTPNPSRLILTRLADAFQITVDELLERSAVSLPHPVNDLRVEGLPTWIIADLNAMWPDLTEADQAAAVEYIRLLWERRTGTRIEPQISRSQESIKK